jgi:hypothetical protein
VLHLPGHDDGGLKTLALSVDRIERPDGPGEIVVLLGPDGTPINVPRSLLPEGLKPGDVVQVTFRRDLEATRRVAARTRQVQEELKTRDPGGDIRL